MKKILRNAIYLIGTIGLLGTSFLIYDEISQGNVCPKIIGIPACYIISACFLAVLLGNGKFISKSKIIYFLGAGLAWSIATYGTLGEIFEFATCPKTASGIPMCFLSFGLFSSLIGLKIWAERK